MTGLVFFAVEVDAFKPGAATISYDLGWAAAPIAALAELPDPQPGAATLLASDVGYRTAPTDAGGVVPYPPYLSQAFSIDRRLNLDPGSSAVAAAWGSVVLSNVAGTYTTIGGSWNSDGRNLRVLAGAKAYDPVRGIYTDPAYTTLAVVFAGYATPWFLDDVSLTIPLRDATYWMEQPLQSTLYLGTGGLAGTSDMIGRPLPKTRGGSTANPVCNVTPVLVDPVNRIYQYSDAPGTVVNLYEGASLTYARFGDTTDLYSGTTASGQYRTDNSRGLFQLGNTPSGSITCDVTGAFPVAGAVSTVAALARYLMAEDMALPLANIDLASFTAADTAYPYVGGVFYDTSSTTDGTDAVDALLAAMGAKLIPTRTGTLRLLMLRALPPTATPVAQFDTTNAVTMTPTALPTTLDPPPYRWRVGYQHNYTVQTTGVLPSATAAQQAYVTTADRYATFASTAVLTAYRRPNDANPVLGGLLRIADAQALANDLGALWSVRRRLYNVVLPIEVALPREIGDVVSLVWPMDDLPNGKLGQIVGEQFRSGDGTITYQILV